MATTLQKNRIGLQRWLPWAFSVGMAFVFLLQSPLQPWGNVFSSGDTSVFLYIAEGMQKGLRPYTDMFDHKGPILYLIQYLGIAISGGAYWGIWLLQWANLALSVWLWLKTAQLFVQTPLLQYAAALLAGISLIFFYDGGNVTEDHALVFISLAVYCFNRLLVTGRQKKREMLLYGACFAVVLLLKINMVAYWVMAMPFAFFFLLYRTKSFKAPMQLFGLFCAGAAAVLLPTLAYLLATGSFGDMIQYNVLFNMTYASANGSSLVMVFKSFYAYFTKVPVVWLAVLGLFVKAVCQKTDAPAWSALLGFGATIGVIAMTGRTGLRYGAILIPALVPVLALVLEGAEPALTRWAKRSQAWQVVVCSAAVLLVLNSGAIQPFVQHSVKALLPNSYYPQLVQYVQQNSQPDDDVLVLGNRAGVYLLAGRRTQQRMFFQTPPIEMDDALCQGFIDSIQQAPPDLIVMTSDTEVLGNTWGVLGALDKMVQQGIYSYTEAETYTAWARAE